MGRPGLSYLEISNAASEIYGRGENPTVDRLLAHLKRGSRSTIHKHLNTWKGKHQPIDTKGVPPELLSTIKGLYDEIKDKACREFEQRSEKYAETTREYLETINNLKKDIESKTNLLSEAANNNKGLLLDLENKQSLLDNAEKQLFIAHQENQNEKAKQENQETLIKELKKQLDKQQDNLLHYQNTILIKHNQEKKILEQKINQLQTELKQKSIQYETIQSLASISSNENDSNKLVIDDLNKELKILFKKNLTLEMSLKNLETQVLEGNARINQQKNQLADNEITLHNKTIEVAILNEKMANLELQLKKTKSKTLSRKWTKNTPYLTRKKN